MAVGIAWQLVKQLGKAFGNGQFGMVLARPLQGSWHIFNFVTIPHHATTGKEHPLLSQTWLAGR